VDATLGIDVGTSNAKAAVVDTAGRVLSQASVAYPTAHLGAGLVEQEANDWWASSCSAVREALTQLHGEDVRIAGIGVSGQGCALTPVDTHGRPLRRAIIWMDTRSESECAWMRSRASDAIQRANGNLIAPYNVDPKILWLRRHEPATYEATICFLTTTAYVTQCLSEAFVMNRSDGGILFSYDLARGDWSDEVLHSLGVPR
jgi:xylulokinase